MEERRALAPLSALSRRGRADADPQPSDRHGEKAVTLASAALTESVKARALALGFDAVAIGSAGPPEHGPALERWLEAGYAGGMGYLGRRLGERLDPRRVLPGAASVVAVALNYYQGEADDPSWAPVARYAWGR